MSYNIKTIPYFDKQAKRLARKYKSLKSELTKLIDELAEEPLQGISLGNNCYKIRLAIKSKGRGKSGGARVITHFKITDEVIYLLSIYDKSEKDNIQDAQIIELLKQIE